MTLDIDKIREQFPILERSVGNRRLVYLDNTATSQTPSSVVDNIVSLYEHTKANVHRGVHTLSQEATDLQEHTRRRVRDYINAASEEEVIFTRGTTEAINLVASSYGDRFRDGDEIILTVMEHHANIVPWQLLQRHHDIKIKVVDINDRGELDHGTISVVVQRAYGIRFVCSCKQRAWHCQPREGDDCHSPQSWCPCTCGRCAGYAPSCSGC